jgi:Tol biopolymer transport system component
MTAHRSSSSVAPQRSSTAHTDHLTSIEGSMQPESSSVRPPLANRAAHLTPPRGAFLVGVLIGTLGAACSDGPIAPQNPQTGSIRASITTTGGDYDEDGYELIIGSTHRVAVPVNGTVSVPAVSAGEHTVGLQAVAGNCDVETQPVSVSVSAGATADVEFRVVCEPTGVVVTVHTSGVDHPPSFTVLVGNQSPHYALPDVPLFVTRLQPGDYVVLIDGVPPGCSFEGDSYQSVPVLDRQVISVQFHVTCPALTGVIEAAVSTSGVDRDPNGYSLRSGNLSAPAPVNGVARLEGVEAGTHDVGIEGIASNCAVEGAVQQTVTVTTGTMIRDTARVTFQVACARTEKIAYQRQSVINMVYRDGTNAVVLLSNAHSASWFPNGRWLVVSNAYCYYYYYFPCGGGLALLDSETGTLSNVSNGAGAFHPAVNKAGDKIAFVRYDTDFRGRLYVVGSDGSALVQIDLSAAGSDFVSAGTPSWSPDGQAIAFQCHFASGESDICLVHTDGSGFARLTSGPDWDADPAWSPDGSVIAFVTNRFGNGSSVALLHLSSGDVTPLTRGNDPAWNAAGSALVFAEECAGAGDPACQRGLFTINPDGTARVRVTTGDHSAPSWRP